MLSVERGREEEFARLLGQLRASAAIARILEATDGGTPAAGCRRRLPRTLAEVYAAREASGQRRGRLSPLADVSG